jgi:hypothetical protein
MNKSVFRPGEAVVVTITARNTTNSTLRVLGLSADSGPPQSAKGTLTFWFGPDGRLDRLQRFPVISRLEARSRGTGGGEQVQLRPGEELTRQFVLTRITPDIGRYTFQVHLQPFSEDDLKRIGKFYSEPAYYEVYGPPLFRRDSKGLLELEEAIRIAAAEAPGEVHLLDAVLIEDEMGFHRWWVNVDYERPEGGLVQTAYLVDPYLGRVWSEAKQFESQIKRDARRVRYDETAPDARTGRGRVTLGPLWVWEETTRRAPKPEGGGVLKGEPRPDRDSQRQRRSGAARDKASVIKNGQRKRIKGLIRVKLGAG